MANVTQSELDNVKKRLGISTDLTPDFTDTLSNGSVEAAPEVITPSPSGEASNNIQEVPEAQPQAVKEYKYNPGFAGLVNMFKEKLDNGGLGKGIKVLGNAMQMGAKGGQGQMVSGFYVPSGSNSLDLGGAMDKYNQEQQALANAQHQKQMQLYDLYLKQQGVDNQGQKISNDYDLGLGGLDVANRNATTGENKLQADIAYNEARNELEAQKLLQQFSQSELDRALKAEQLAKLQSGKNEKSKNADDQIELINDLQKRISDNRNFYGSGFFNQYLVQPLKYVTNSKQYQEARRVSNEFKPVVLDLLQNFPGAISEGERLFLTDFAEGKNLEFDSLISLLESVKKRIANSAGKEQQDFNTPEDPRTIAQNQEEIIG